MYSHYHWMKRQNSLGNRYPVCVYIYIYIYRPAALTKAWNNLNVHARAGVQNKICTFTCVCIFHRELSEDLARFSPEIETFRKYTPPFECALDIMGVSHVSSHLFSKKIISFHLHSSENISSRLLTREILRLLHVKHSQRHNFRKLITCLNSLEDPSGTITEIEHHYFSLIHMKLSEKYKIFPRLEGNCFLVTIYLSLLDDRVEDAISSSDTLCVKLELNDQKTCRTNSEVSENKGAISITLVNFIDSDLSGPLYEVANVNSSKPGCLELELLLFHPHTLNLVSHN